MKLFNSSTCLCSCQVNLKEQGRLIRQDEFTVFFRKKKCVRRVFLFEDLILLSKTKRTEIGNDVYVYKQSFKVCTYICLLKSYWSFTQAYICCEYTVLYTVLYISIWTVLLSHTTTLDL